jgi:hypothetical protein
MAASTKKTPERETVEALQRAAQALQRLREKLEARALIERSGHGR